MNDAKIISVKIAEGSVIHKTLNAYNQKVFGIATVLELEDGRKIPSLKTTQKKKDLMPSVERMNAHAQDGTLSACFREDGSFWGTSTKYRISAK